MNSMHPNRRSDRSKANHLAAEKEKSERTDCTPPPKAKNIVLSNQLFHKMFLIIHHFLLGTHCKRRQKHCYAISLTFSLSFRSTSSHHFPFEISKTYDSAGERIQRWLRFDSIFALSNGRKTFYIERCCERNI